MRMCRNSCEFGCFDLQFFCRGSKWTSGSLQQRITAGKIRFRKSMVSGNALSSPCCANDIAAPRTVPKIACELATMYFHEKRDYSNSLWRAALIQANSCPKMSLAHLLTFFDRNGSVAHGIALQAVRPNNMLTTNVLRRPQRESIARACFGNSQKMFWDFRTFLRRFR